MGLEFAGIHTLLKTPRCFLSERQRTRRNSDKLGEGEDLREEVLAGMF